MIKAIFNSLLLIAIKIAAVYLFLTYGLAIVMQCLTNILS